MRKKCSFKTGQRRLFLTRISLKVPIIRIRRRNSLAELDEVPGISLLSKCVREVALLETVPMVRHLQWCLHERASTIEVALGVVTGIGATVSDSPLLIGLGMLVLRQCIPQSLDKKNLIIKYPSIHATWVSMRESLYQAVHEGRQEMRARGWKEWQIDTLTRGIIQSIAGSTLNGESHRYHFRKSLGIRWFNGH